MQWKLKKFDTKYPDLYGIALICKVFGASRAADTFGPIPYSKIGPTADVPFDTVQDAYNAFLPISTRRLGYYQLFKDIFLGFSIRLN